MVKVKEVGGGAGAVRVLSRDVGYVPSRMSEELTSLIYTFPVAMYNRLTREGVTYPTISAALYLPKFTVEKVSDKEFIVKEAVGYVPCPVCGEVVKVTGERRFVFRWRYRLTYELARELAISTLSSKAAQKLSDHLNYHRLRPKNIGYRNVVIVREVGPGEYVVFRSRISMLKCKADKKVFTGMYMYVNHLITSHSKGRKVSEAFKLYGKIRKLLYEVANLKVKNIPYVGCFRTTFTITLTPGVVRVRGARFLSHKRFSKVLHAYVLRDRDGNVGLMFRLLADRPTLIPLHHPVMEMFVPTLAFKLSRETFTELIDEASKVLKEGKHSTERLETFEELVTGRFRYLPVESKYTYFIPLTFLKRWVDTFEKYTYDLKRYINLVRGASHGSRSKTGRGHGP